MPTRAIRISPMLATDDMDASLSFFHSVLGFITTLHSTDYSVVERDRQTVHLMRAADESVMKSMREHTEIYIEVSGIQDLWEHVKTFKDRYRIRDLFARDHGMTEFHIADPHSCLIFVGEPTKNLRP
jgi:predicted enzyme related to lactoylglutathione lyase